jgi:GntR family transcriptional regulator / MocR family aminotransferase
MTANWTTLRELLLPAASAGGRGRSVEMALRAAIRAGRLAPGLRLPSSRDLAAQLGVARGTVTAAYGQLTAEGYLTARRGSGTTVATTLSAPTPTPPPAPVARQWRYDLRPGLPALSEFPRAEWLAATRSALTELPAEALGYPDPAGLADLRAELAAYLGRVRAVTTTPADIVITHGAAEGLSTLTAVLRAGGHESIGTEDPGHPGQTDLVREHGLHPVPVPVDDDGIVVDAIPPGCRAVVVTAAHQFPVGTTLHPERRHALLRWARDNDGVVIEDDYDAEHRYDRPALRAMQAMDPSRVVYLGSVSKTLAPALRLGWLVLPPALLADAVSRKQLTDLGCSPLPQAAFARLLRGGGYDRHLRRTRAAYRKRRDALLSGVATHLPSWQPIGVAAGLHVVLRLPDDVDDAVVSQRLAAAGIHAPALSGYTKLGTYPGLVLGYAATTPDRLRAAVLEIALIVTPGARQRS